MHMTGMCKPDAVKKAREKPKRFPATIDFAWGRDHEHSPSVSGLVSNQSAHPYFQECISSAEITSGFFSLLGEEVGKYLCLYRLVARHGRSDKAEVGCSMPAERKGSEV